MWHEGLKVAVLPGNDTRSKYLRDEYVARINRVIDHIQTNIDHNLYPETLAEFSG